MSAPDEMFGDGLDDARLAIMRRAEAFDMVRITDRALSRAAHAFADLDYPDHRDDLKAAVIDAMFDHGDASRDARARDAELDRQLRNLAMRPLPPEVLP